MKYLVFLGLLAAFALGLLVGQHNNSPHGQSVTSAGVGPDTAARVDIAAVNGRGLLDPGVQAEQKYRDLPDYTEIEPSKVMSKALQSSSYGLFPMQVKCYTLSNEVKCDPEPGTLPFEHPYFSYPTESLEAMPGDAIANHVLGIRLARQNPDKAFHHIVTAVGQSGKPGSLTDFYNESDWSVSSINGEPAIENMKKGLMLLTAAERMGHPMAHPELLRSKLEALVPAEDLAEVDAAVEALLRQINSIDVSPEYQS